MQTSTTHTTATSPATVVPDLYCTVDEFARSLKVSRGTIFGWLRAGMPSLRAGRCRRIIIVPAQRWLEAGGAQQRQRSPRARRGAGPNAPATGAAVKTRASTDY